MMTRYEALRLFDNDRDLLLEFVAWLIEYPGAVIQSLDPEEACYIIRRFFADHGLACDEYAPDTLNPDPLDRDICTTCHFRGMDHGA